MYIALNYIPGSAEPCEVQVTVSDGFGRDLGTTYFTYDPKATYFESYLSNAIPLTPLEIALLKQHRITQERERERKGTSINSKQFLAH